jgi:hypothetical protein
LLGLFDLIKIMKIKKFLCNFFYFSGANLENYCFAGVYRELNLAPLNPQALARGTLVAKND